MQRREAYTFALRLNGWQERLVRRLAGSTRFVFNEARAVQIERHAQGERKLRYAQWRKLLSEWRANPDFAWLALAPVHPLQRSLEDLDRAYTNFVTKHAKFPRFEKRGESPPAHGLAEPYVAVAALVWLVARRGRPAPAPARHEVRT